MQNKAGSLTQQQGNEALKLLSKLIVLRGESVHNYSNLNQMVAEFAIDGYTLDDIRKVVEAAKKLPRFNPLSYGDLVKAFEEAGNLPMGFEDYKRRVADLVDKNLELQRQIDVLGWYKERWEEQNSGSEKQEEKRA